MIKLRIQSEISMSKLFPQILQLNKRTKKEISKISNASILTQLDMLFIESIEALKNQNHMFVANVLKSFISYDLVLRHIIKHQLTEEPLSLDDITDIEPLINNFIELQSHFNIRRINLMTEVVLSLLESYNQVITNMSLNLDYAMQSYNKTKSSHNYYLQEIKKIVEQRNGDEYQKVMYNECMQLFEELDQISYKIIRKMMNIELKTVQD